MNNANILLPSAQNILEKHFNICGVFNLNAYMHCMSMLYADLKNTRKEAYNPSDRIVFLLPDYDYFPDASSPGFTLYNLQLILSNLDISNYFCLLVTAHPDYNNYTKQVHQLLTTDDCHIRSITTVLDTARLSPRNQSREDNTDQIKKSFCVLSRLSRDHRSYFFSRLFARDLQNDGAIAYNNIPQSVDQQDQIEVSTVDHLGLLTVPSVLPKILIKNTRYRKQYSDFIQKIPQYRNFNEDNTTVDLNNKTQCDLLLTGSPLIQSLIYVGLESRVDLLKVFTSRISMRGIAERRPFLLLAVPGTLRFLKSLGFKTFDDFWDEGYDEIQDFELRVEAILNILQQFAKLSPGELQQKHHDMQSIIDYNYDYYYNQFENNLLIQFDQDCQNNLVEVV